MIQAVNCIILEISGNYSTLTNFYSSHAKQKNDKYFTHFAGITNTAYFTIQETCGNITTIEDYLSDFNHDRLSVLFQTNRNTQDRGFFMVVTCVSPDFNNINGCTPAQLRQTEAPSVEGRRKRLTEVASSQCGCYVCSVSFNSILSNHQSKG